VILPENAVSDSLATRRLVKLGALHTIETGTWAITRTEDETPAVISKAIERFCRLF